MSTDKPTELPSTEVVKTERFVKIELVYLTSPAEKAHMNYSRFSHVGPDVFLSLGSLDDQQIVEAGQRRLEVDAMGLEQPEPEEGQALRAFISHRFVMSFDGLASLRANIEDIWQKLEAKGLVQSPQQLSAHSKEDTSAT